MLDGGDFFLRLCPSRDLRTRLIVKNCKHFKQYDLLDAEPRTMRFVPLVRQVIPK